MVRTSNFAAIDASVRYGKYHGDPAGAARRFIPPPHGIVYKAMNVVGFWLKKRLHGIGFRAVVPEMPCPNGFITFKPRGL